MKVKDSQKAERGLFGLVREGKRPNVDVHGKDVPAFP